MGGKKEEKTVAPEDLTPAERAYYRETWGFDPVADKKDSPPLPYVLFYYETPIPLENDPELQAAGVTMHTRVEVDEEGVSHNRIVFKRGDKSAKVTCVHTTVYSAPAREVLKFSEKKLEEIFEKTEGQPTLLPPWEHFAALKSFAGGLAAVGIFQHLGFTRLCKKDATIWKDPNELKYNGDWELGFHDQLRDALIVVAPETIFPVLDASFADLLDRVSVQWLLDLSVFPGDDTLFGKYRGIYPLQRVFNNHPFLESLDPATRKKLFQILLKIVKMWEEDNERAEDNEIEKNYSPRILLLTLTESFVNTLSPGTTLQTLWILEGYMWYCRPENKSNAPGHVRAEELEAPYRFLLHHGLSVRDSNYWKKGYFDQLSKFFYLIPNPLELKNPRAVFDDKDFVASEFLRDFDSVHLREILRSEIEKWNGIPLNTSIYLPYLCMRLLLEREMLSTDNAECLRQLVTVLGDEWKTRYLSALTREFKFITEFVGTTSRGYAMKGK